MVTEGVIHWTTDAINAILKKQWSSEVDNLSCEFTQRLHVLQVMNLEGSCFISSLKFLSNAFLYVLWSNMNLDPVHYLANAKTIIISHSMLLSDSNWAVCTFWVNYAIFILYENRKIIPRVGGLVYNWSKHPNLSAFCHSAYINTCLTNNVLKS